MDAGEFFRLGAIAYELGEHHTAIKLLNEGLDLDPIDWQSRFYLAMAFTKTGQFTQAREQFLLIRDFCTDAELCRKASAFLLVTSNSIANSK